MPTPQNTKHEEHKRMPGAAYVHDIGDEDAYCETTRSHAKKGLYFAVQSSAYLQHAACNDPQGMHTDAMRNAKLQSGRILWHQWSVASDTENVFPHRCVVALHPTAICLFHPNLEAMLPTSLDPLETPLPTSKGLMSPIFGLRSRCHLCDIPKKDHATTHPHVYFYVTERQFLNLCPPPPRSPPEAPPQPTAPMHKMDQCTLLRHSSATMARRGQSYVRDRGTD